MLKQSCKSSPQTEELKVQLLSRSPILADMLSQYKPSEFVAEFDAMDPFLGYNFIPEKVVSSLLKLQDFHSTSISDYLGYCLLSLMERFEERFFVAGFPELFRELFLDFHANIRRRMADAITWGAQLHSDIFLKDLGICRLTLVPCVSHVIYPWSGFPRRALLFQSPIDLAQSLTFFTVKTHGFRPFMEHHVHPHMRDNFNPKGREQFYRIASELLNLWPEKKGIMASSWYFDPAVQKISPHLGYLREVPLNNNAIFLRAEATPSLNTINSSLSKAVRRRRMYEEGKYMPTSYYMVWWRDDLLKVYG